MTLKEYETGLRRLEEELRQELAGAIAARETGTLGLLESRLTAVCGKLADPADSLVRHNQVLEEISRLLPEINEALPGFQATTVRRHLHSGDAEVVRALLTEAALQAPAASSLAGRIRFCCGRLAEEQTEFAAAGELYQQACAGGARNPEYLYAAGRMARILGNDEEARQLLEEALAAGADSDAQDLARYELARVYLRAEQAGKAEPLLQQALTGLSERLGAGHPALGPVLYELGALHESAGQYEQAAPLYERALAVSEQITDSLMRFVKACIRLGVDGFYASTQGGEAGRFEDPGVFTRHVKPFDLVLMDEMKRTCPFNILHVCDYNAPYADLSPFVDYPGHIVNCNPQLTGRKVPWGEIARMFGRPCMGGMDRHGLIASGGPAEIGREVAAVLKEATQPFMLGADCTLPGDIKWENIRAAIDAAHAYKL